MTKTDAAISKAASGVASGAQSEGEMIRQVGLRKILKEDYIRHRRDWTWAGLQALWVHRIGAYGATLRRPWRSVFAALHGVGHVICRNLYGIELARSVQIGRRMMIAHQHGITVQKYARFGDDCLLRNSVTLGAGPTWVKGKGPVVGNNVAFEVGAIVLGNVTIGDNVRIGPNCVVTTDVPADHAVLAQNSEITPRVVQEPAA